MFSGLAQGESQPAPVQPAITDAALVEQCVESLKAMPGKSDEKDLKMACEQVKTEEGCTSVQGTKIFYFEKKGTNKNPKKIFAKALIHGDETTAGVVARAWLVRLAKIDPRNTWRVIPIANPDGLKARTRYNANGVDLNRNFPSGNWETEALAYWKKNARSDKRRYPGPQAASEVETRCLMKQFDDFKPDFIISIHTPLGVLDLDGPKMSPPNFKPLPWQSLGNFPGSLGRYMWKDRNIPVLTIELKPDQSITSLEQFDKLQDIAGTIAIQADQLKPKKPASDKKQAATNSSESAANN
jgi:hypothetical protein